MHKVLTAIAAALLATACAPAADPGNAAPGPAEAARHRAALATLHVCNETERVLTIAYRHAVPPTAAVRIGVALPAQRSTVAPVPAGEPIVLTATADDGFVSELPPRTFEVGEEWCWTVRA